MLEPRILVSLGSNVSTTRLGKQFHVVTIVSQNKEITYYSPQMEIWVLFGDFNRPELSKGGGDANVAFVPS